MSDQVRIRLKQGGRELEIEASKANVDELLAKWWQPGNADASEFVGDDEVPDPPMKPRKSAESRRPAANQEPKVDPQIVVNAIKERDDFDTLQETVLHEGDLLRQIKLVLVADARPKTTGEVAEVLQLLGVRTDVSTVSKSIKRNQLQFMNKVARRRGNTPRYTLVGRIAKEFEESLKQDASTQ